VKENGPSVQVDFGAGQPGRIDGVLGGEIAIEMESRTSKQIRGAILDLIWHPYPKKLLILLPVHMSNPEVAVKQSENILARFLPRSNFRVVLLRGSGDKPSLLDHDTSLLADALAQLGYKSQQLEQPSADQRRVADRGTRSGKSHTQTGQEKEKYKALANHLQNSHPSQKELTLTFTEIEKLIKAPLPESAFKHRAWWSNQTDVSKRPQARAWISAGFQVDKVRLDKQNGQVWFKRR